MPFSLLYHPVEAEAIFQQTQNEKSVPSVASVEAAREALDARMLSLNEEILAISQKREEEKQLNSVTSK